MPTECKPKHSIKSDPSKGVPKHAYVLNMDGSEQNYLYRREYLKGHDIDLERMPGVDGQATYGNRYSTTLEGGTVVRIYTNPVTKKQTREGKEGYLTAGERGYLATMRKLFEDVLARPEVKTVMVVDDDSVFSCSFKQVSEGRWHTFLLYTKRQFAAHRLVFARLGARRFCPAFCMYAHSSQAPPLLLLTASGSTQS